MKKLLSTIMALVMLLSLVPMAVVAEGVEFTEANSEAQINGLYYETLDDAVSKVADGDTIKLVKDVTGQVVIPADKTITLDLGGHKLTNIADAIINKGTLTVDNGTIESKSGVGIGVDDNSKTTIQPGVTIEGREGAVITGDATGATIIINGGNFSAKDNAVIAGNGTKRDGEANTITINGGTFTGNIKTGGYIACGIYAPWKDVIIVNGGTFIVKGGTGVVGRAGKVYINGGTFTCTGTSAGWVGDNKNQIPAGQACYFDSAANYPAYDKNTDGIFVKGGAFTDLASAVKYATNGATITLAGDVALTSPVTVDKDLTIDMNGYDITANGCRALHQKQGTLDIIGKGTIAANKVAENGLSTIRVGDSKATNTAVFTLGKDVTVTSDSCYGITYFGMKDETLTINGTVAVTGEATALSGNGSSTYKDVNVSVTVNGTVTAERANAIYKPEKGTLTINGVVKGVGGIEVKSGTLAIGANAEVTATAEETSHNMNDNGCSTSGYALAAVANESYQGNVNITVSGGKVIGKVAKVVDDANVPEGKLTIEGGTFTVDPSAFLADESRLIAVPSKGGVYVVQPKEITVGDTTTKVDVSNDGKTVTETETKTEKKDNVTTKTETVTVKDDKGNVTKVTESKIVENNENGKTETKTTVDGKTVKTDVTVNQAPTTASDVRLNAKALEGKAAGTETSSVAVNKDSMAALTGDTVKDVVIETDQATLKLNKTAVKTMEGNVPTNGKMTLNVTVTENTAKEVTVTVEAKTQGDKNVFPPETKNTNGEIEITIPYTGTADYLDLWYVTNTSTYMGRFPVVNGYVSFKVTHFSQYNLIPVASSGSSVIKTGAGSSAASTTQTVTTDLTPGSITKVTVDGKVVDAKYYTVSGSNVTFTAEFLKTLKNGSHTVTVENATKIAKGVFTVNNPTTAVQAPTTADAGIALYAGMAIASVMGTGVVFTSRKRKNH